MDVNEFINTILDCTRKINENTNKVFTPLYEKYKLTMLQLSILTELKQSGSHTIGSLAERVSVAGTNLSPMCKKLEVLDLIKRVREQNDERVVKVALTEKGETVVSEVDQYFFDIITYCTKGESDDFMNNIVIGMKSLNNMLIKAKSRLE